MPSDANTIGAKIKALRKQQKLTLTELAEKTNRSASLLSQIENDNVNPSFSTMQTIADALNVKLSQVIVQGSPVENGDAYQLKPSARKVLSTQGGVQHQLLTHGFQLSFELVIVEFPPGASTGDFLYTHDGEECGYLLDGELSVETNDKVHYLKPGDSITLKSSIPHRLSNPGKKIAKAAWVNSMPYIFSTQ